MRFVTVFIGVNVGVQWKSIGVWLVGIPTRGLSMLILDLVLTCLDVSLMCTDLNLGSLTTGSLEASVESRQMDTGPTA